MDGPGQLAASKLFATTPKETETEEIGINFYDHVKNRLDSRSIPPSPSLLTMGIPPIM